MDSRDVVKKAFSRLRNVTIAVQIMPFVYSFFYIIILVLYLFVSDTLMQTLDAFFYVSPVAVASNLILSSVLNLCKWHKAACIVPIAPQVNILLDRFVYEFSLYAELAHLVLIIAMLITVLISAYHVFFKH